MQLVDTRNEDALAALREAFAASSIKTSEADLLTYSYDGALDRGRPFAAVLAETVEDVRGAVEICRRFKVPYVARGAGTNLSGGCIPIKGGVVIVLSKMDRILEIDTRRRVAAVEPGVVNLKFQQKIEPLGLFYAPDPSSHKVCTLGGNFAENSGGPRCLKYGVTTNHVVGAEIVMPDGKVRRFFLEDEGPDLLGLMAGSEGTLGIATRLWLKLTPLPERIETMLCPFASLEGAIQAVSDIVEAGVVPRVLEAMDKLTMEAVEAHVQAGYPTEAEAVLLIELDGRAEEVEADARTVQEMCRKNGAIRFERADDPAKREKLWEGRRGAYAAMARIAPNVLVEDGAVPRDKLPAALAELKRIARHNEVRLGLLFHAGDGNLHPNIAFDDRNLPEVKRAKRAGYEMLKACVRLGGSISGEHGIGVDKRRAMSWLFDPDALDYFRRLKGALDPGNLCNPDKLLPIGSRDQDESLRISPAPLSAAAAELVEAVRVRFRQRRPSVPMGRSSAAPSSWRNDKARLLGLDRLDKIVDFDRKNLSLTVEAGASIASVREEVEREGFYLPIPEDRGSFGGLIATKRCPAFRDEILGGRILSVEGTVVDLSSKVMKNVAGYDVLRLLFGSWGSLAVLLDVTMKIYRRPLSLPPGSTPSPFSPTEPHWILKRALDPELLLQPALFPPEAEP